MNGSSRLFSFFWVMVLLLGLSACSEPYEGFSSFDGEGYYRLNALGDGPELKNVAYAEWSVDLGLLREANKSYQSGFGVEVSDQDFWVKNDALRNALLHLRAGDSVSYLVPFSAIKEGVFDEFSNDGVKVHDTVMMNIELKVELSMDSLAYANYLHELEIERQAQASFQLKTYLEEKGMIENYQFYQGTYWRFLDSIPSGENIQYGDEIAVKLKGSFLDGKVFDSAKDSSEYIYFPLGKAGQVVRGIELILPKMSIGERTEVICPSYLAFGNQGSSTGLVPGRTPVMFEVELINLEELLNQ
jgi:FKBP-type peptidyl-prolyl cis-trans isomerase